MHQPQEFNAWDFPTAQSCGEKQPKLLAFPPKITKEKKDQNCSPICSSQIGLNLNIEQIYIETV